MSSNSLVDFVRVPVLLRCKLLIASGGIDSYLQYEAGKELHKVPNYNIYPRRQTRQTTS
jgi:hypothetical protein